MRAFEITWKNPKSKNWTDVLRSELFDNDVANLDVTHPFYSPHNIPYMAECKLTVEGGIATLIYPEHDDWYDGTTKIVFADDSRERIKDVLWADPGEDFEHLHPRPIFKSVADIDAEEETKRQERLGKISSRPEQIRFKAMVRDAYGKRCAITGCSTPSALEAAHIRVVKGADFNQLNNGILLRADIHALFDSGMIALSEDGKSVEAKDELVRDETYQWLKGHSVRLPDRDAPSRENIMDHRERFSF